MIKKSKNSRFLRNILHDIRTPLTILKGEIGFALKKERSVKEYKKVLISSIEEVDRISLMLDNFSLLMRFEDGGMITRKKPVNLNNLIKGALRQKNIKTSFSPEKEIIVNGDENRLKILFANLFAAAAGDEPVPCSVYMKSKNKNATVRINGANTAALSESKNFNLGLTVSKLIVKAHCGKLDFSRCNSLTVSIPIPRRKK